MYTLHVMRLICNVDMVQNRLFLSAGKNSTERIIFTQAIKFVQERYTCSNDLSALNN